MSGCARLTSSERGSHSYYSHWCQTHPPHPSPGEGPVFLCFGPLRCIFSGFPYIQTLNIFFFFEWRDPDTLEATKYTWTVLLQDLGDSPHLFGKAFTRELSLVKGTLLPYVDDLLKLVREQLLFSLFSRTRASGVKTDPVQLNSVALGWPSSCGQEWAARLVKRGLQAHPGTRC